DRQQRLHERDRELVAGSQEEEALRRLVPRALAELEQTVPPGPLLGLRAPLQDARAEGGIDVLAVHEHVRRPFTHGLTFPHRRVRGSGTPPTCSAQASKTTRRRSVTVPASTLTSAVSTRAR